MILKKFHSILNQIFQESTQQPLENNSIQHILNKEFNSIIKKDLEYLIKDFKFKQFIKQGTKNIWYFVFISNSKEYKIKFYTVENKGKWFAKVFIYWKSESKENKNGAGKDAELKCQTCNSYKEFIKQCNVTFKNHPLISAKNYNDNWENNMDLEALPLLKQLQKIGDKLSFVNINKNFDDIILIYNEIKELKKDDELIKYFQKIAPQEQDKQNQILMLQKMFKHGFYKDMKKMNKL